jgi:hypothetical protein
MAPEVMPLLGEAQLQGTYAQLLMLRRSAFVDHVHLGNATENAR